MAEGAARQDFKASRVWRVHSEYNDSKLVIKKYIFMFHIHVLRLFNYIIKVLNEQFNNTWCAILK